MHCRCSRCFVNVKDAHFVFQTLLFGRQRFFESVSNVGTNTDGSCAPHACVCAQQPGGGRAKDSYEVPMEVLFGGMVVFAFIWMMRNDQRYGRSIPLLCMSLPPHPPLV